MKARSFIGDLFEPKPSRWGLRGDPYLWHELRIHFANHPMPQSSVSLEQEFEKAFFQLTDHTLSEEGSFYIERFSHGGMSSGHISLGFWLNRALPLLKTRLESLLSKGYSSESSTST